LIDEVIDHTVHAVRDLDAAGKSIAAAGLGVRRNPAGRGRERG
jgi:hypothetical protein